MTTGTIVRTILRRWYVALAGLAFTGLALVWLAPFGGVYYSQANAILVSPGDQLIGSMNGGVETLAHFGAFVEREVLYGHPANRVGSSTVTLYGAGIRQGYTVALPDTGGQWENNFNQPLLTVKVVGDSEEWVAQTQSALLSRIEKTVHDLQAKIGVPAASTIAAERVPAVATIEHVGVGSATKTRALVAFGAVGIGLSFSAAVFVERIAALRGASIIDRQPHRDARYRRESEENDLE